MDSHGRIAVLLVDDDEDLLELNSMLLARRGFEVHAAPDVKAALQIMLTERLDVVVTDLEMPVVDGFQLNESIRLSEMRIPVIALSGASDPRVLQRAQLEGFREVLTKPCDPTRLELAVHATLLAFRRFTDAGFD